MGDTLTDERLATALVALSHHVLHLFTEVGRTHRLSQQQVRLLCAINAYGGVGMSELGRQTQLEKSNLSNLVDRLEQRGLVTRTRDTDDRRVTYAELTGEGHELAVRCHAEVVARVNELAGKLPRTEQDRLANAVGRMMA
ncbi:MarR family winged helix-turn-helix transcriptional regulator [Actinophytocola sp.]|uniref:MarR family winged helix-turn-helix transcriptional regulator n=1 Tax=Actinophytocola sp. TaxID=1872138 RepID=UPI00389A636C